MQARNRIVAGSKGFSLLEVIVASAIVGVLCVGVLTVMIKVDNADRYLHNRTIASRAAHQMMEILMSEDLDSMLLQNGNTFVVTDLTTSPVNGTITMTDLNWIAANNAYRIKLEVPAFGVVLYSIRTRT